MVMPTTDKYPSAMPWFGGKSYYSGRGIGEWITKQLPTDVETYAEPYAGMLGILRQRKPAALEIINDMNSDLTNWWEAVRDHHEELVEMLLATPNSEELFYTLRDTDASDWECVRKAWRFTVLVLLSHSVNMTAWQMWWKPDKPTGRQSRLYTLTNHMEALRERVRHVHIHNTSAEKILERLAENEKCLIYADPPYPSAAGRTTYKHHKLDVDGLLDLFAKQKGKVAISGYPGCPWNELGWRYEDLDDYCNLADKDAVVERLWMNYDSVSAPSLFD